MIVFPLLSPTIAKLLPECTRNKRTLYALEERIENLEATLHDTRRTVEKLERDIEVLKVRTDSNILVIKITF